MRSILVVLIACSFGCTDNTPATHGTPMLTALVGDWFLCDAPDCSTLGNHGARWSADGTWVLLEVRGAQTLDPAGTYCSSPHQADQGPYDFDEPTGTLVMTDNLGRDAGGGTVTFAPPMATLTATNASVSLYLPINPPRLTGACPISL